MFEEAAQLAEIDVKCVAEDDDFCEYELLDIENAEIVISKKSNASCIYLNIQTDDYESFVSVQDPTADVIAFCIRISLNMMIDSLDQIEWLARFYDRHVELDSVESASKFFANKVDLLTRHRFPFVKRQVSHTA